METDRMRQSDLKKQMRWCAHAQWILAAGTLLLLCGIIFLGIRPARARLTELRRTAFAKREQMRVNQARIDNLPVLRQQIQTMAEALHDFDRKLPRQEELSQFVRDVTEISREASLRNLTWRPDSKARAIGPVSQLPIEFRFETDYAGLAQFLRRTEQMQRITRVSKLDVHSSSTTDGWADVQLTMNIYYGED